MFLKATVLFGLGSILFLLGVLLPQVLVVPAMARGVLFGVGGGLFLAGFIRSLQPDGCDASTPGLRRRYLREFIPAMAGYVVLLVVSILLLKRVDDQALRAVIALLPVLPIALSLRAIIRFVRDADELQRQIELEAVSIATALVSQLYMAGGFLQLAKVIDIPSGVAMIWVFPLLCVAYGLIKAVVARRFR